MTLQAVIEADVVIDAAVTALSDWVSAATGSDPEVGLRVEARRDGLRLAGPKDAVMAGVCRLYEAARAGVDELRVTLHIRPGALAAEPAPEAVATAS